MRTNKLNYHLPEELIAQQPCAVRSQSRLLVYNRSNSQILDRQFSQLGDFLSAGDCLVLNDTKVLQARFFAKRATGGKLEGLFLSEKNGVWQVMIKGGRRLKEQETIYLQDRESKNYCQVRILDRQGEGVFKLKPETEVKTEKVLEQIGFMPLPPYIKRSDDLDQAAKDKQRYQTVYANRTGAIAAPTAGLHFTKDLIEQLKTNGINFAYVTLHVGVGTFKPISSEKLEGHKIHSELFNIDADNARLINEIKKRKGRIVAVGTTSVRVLETIVQDEKVKADSGSTSIFIKPGYKFQLVDAMITNFHLPRSTLLALVAAFAGLENILKAYKHAVEQRYRFYSYGDAMFLY